MGFELEASSAVFEPRAEILSEAKDLVSLGWAVGFEPTTPAFLHL